MDYMLLDGLITLLLKYRLILGSFKGALRPTLNLFCILHKALSYYYDRRVLL